ncbi:Autotransporter adhesin [hydrothermal vent metagenome]|uniref:Autotransporter adhesin n=1 Tax=hydrothermal vent metagenome TaxID=652676 RepID=A0A1W1BZC7_9ZZZZ
MKLTVTKTLSVATLAFIITGCGGSSSGGNDKGDLSNSSSSTGTGYYVDSAIEGINYKCGTQTGTTNSDGKFTYELNKECTFSIGNTILRKILKDELSGKKVTIRENNMTIARLLQTLDDDGNASNGINITKNMRTTFDENNISDIADIDSVYSVISDTEGYHGHLVTETETNHHLQTGIKTMLAGKTFYAVTESNSTFLGMPVTTNDTGYVMPFKFNDDLTMLNEDSEDPTPIRLDGNKLIYTSDNNGNYQLIEGKTDKYIKVTTIFVAGSGTVGHMRLYYNKNYAQAYADTIKNSSSNNGSGGTHNGGSTQNGIQSISSEKLAGYTVVAEYKEGVKVMNIKKVSYIFLEGERAIVVIDCFDGSRKVLRDDAYYHENGNHAVLMNPTWDNGDKIALFAPDIETDNGYDKITVGHSDALPYKVTTIVSNSENGINEATVTATGSSSSTSNTNNTVPNVPDPMHHNIGIYNNINQGKAFNGNSQYLSQNSGHVLPSDTPVHCTDYGYTSSDKITEHTSDGVHVVNYSHGQFMCMELDYASAGASGSKSYVTY